MPIANSEVHSIVGNLDIGLGAGRVSLYSPHASDSNRGNSLPVCSEAADGRLGRLEERNLTAEQACHETRKRNLPYQRDPIRERVPL